MTSRSVHIRKKTERGGTNADQNSIYEAAEDRGRTGRRVILPPQPRPEEQHLTERQLIPEGLTNIGYAKLECRDRMRKCMKHEEEKRVKITPWRKERKTLLHIPVCEYSR